MGKPFIFYCNALHRCILLNLLWLSACAPMPPAPPAVTTLPAVYEVDGRIAIIWDGQGQQGHFRWQHQPTYDRIDLRGPLGQTLGRLEWDQQQARFYDQHKQSYFADNVEILAVHHLGWYLPVNDLRYWLFGLASPRLSAQWSHHQGQRLLRQNGWQISYSSEENTLPTSLKLWHPRVEVKIILDSWSLEPR